MAISDLVGSLFLDYEKFSETVATGTYAFTSVLFLLAAVLLPLGLVGLYAYQSEAMGALGLVAFLVAFVGSILMAGAIWSQAFVAPTLSETAPEFLDEDPGGRLGVGFFLSFGLVSVGWLLFGIATLRARVFPRWAAILLVIGAALAFLPLPLTGTALAVAVAVLGFFLFTGTGATTERPSRVS